MTERSGQKRVRGIAVRVVVFLVLGAVVNVAVAWGCVLWGHKLGSPDPEGRIGRDVSDGGNWPTVVYTDWPSHFSFAYESRYYAYSDVHYVCYLPDRPDEGWSVDFNNAGLPFRALRAIELMYTYGSTQIVNDPPHGIWQAGFKPPTSFVEWSDAMRLEKLPIRPVWPGFAINTLFYAAILWLLFAFPFTLRRWRRIKRGLCPKCAYPVGTSDVCTECGEKIIHRRDAEVAEA